MTLAGAPLTVAVLGPFTVSVAGRPVTTISERPRSVLAVLALSAGQAVSVDRLATAVWGDDQPANARRAVQLYVSRLRSVLGAEAVRSASSGYVLAAAPEHVDALRFAQLLDAAAQTSDRAGERGWLTEALALWRGTPFVDLRSAWLADVESAQLTERYLAAVERLIDIDIDDGKFNEVVGQLQVLIVRHPLRERFWGQLMLALSRVGRQAEALEAYRRLHRMLADELGVAPHDAVQLLHRQILTDSRTAESGPTSRPALPPFAVLPRQLPLEPRDFVGRTAELAYLDGQLGAQLSGRPRVVVVSGMAGAGKTGLTLHWAHRAAAHFPDGQLFADLNGYTTTSPTQPGHVLGSFLRAFGVAPAAVPSEPTEAAALYRTVLAHRRVLIVLDNARTADQVRPLLPGTSDSAVVITSRHQLGGLQARDGASLLNVNRLGTAEAVTLLVSLLPAEHANAERKALVGLAEHCAGLPLAMRICAANLASRPHTTVDDVVAEMNEGGRLASLSSDGDETHAVMSAFANSYRLLSADAQQAFELLGLVPLRDYTAEAAAALVGCPPAHARRIMRELLAANLLEQRGHDRYTFHDLVREFAETRAQALADRSGAERLLCWYLHGAYQAYRRIYPAGRLAEPERSNVPEHLPFFMELNDAVAWCDAERLNLVTVVRYAAGHELHYIAAQLSAALTSYFDLTKQWDDWVGTHTIGARSAAAIGDKVLQARLINFTGVAVGQKGDLENAIGLHQEALTISRSIGDQIQEAAILNSLGVTTSELGRDRQAIDFFTEALDLRRRLGDAEEISISLNNLAIAHLILGKYATAIEYFREALLLQDRLDSGQTRLDILDGLANAYLKSGDTRAAEESLNEAIELGRRHGYRWGVASVLTTLGHLRSATGRVEDAHDCWTEALATFEDLGDPRTDEVRRLIDILPQTA